MVWLKHVRGAPFAESGTLCGGEAGCVLVPGGVNCSSLSRLAGFSHNKGAATGKHKNTMYLNDAPFIAEAALSVLPRRG